jgi:hypothetical protein
MSSDDSFPLLLSHSDLPGPFLICIHAFDGLCDCDVHQCQVQMNSRVLNGKWLCPMTEQGFGALSSLGSFTRGHCCCFCLRSSWMPHLSDSLVWETRHARGTPPSFLNPEIEISRFCKRCLSGLSIVTSQLFPYQVSGKMAASYTCPRIFQALSSSTSKLTWKWCQRILRRRWEMKPITPQVSGMVPW